MTAELYLAYVVATLVVVAIPGPTVLLVVSYALAHGRKAATACVLGVALGDATAATASLLGLGAVLATSATAFSVLKWVGAAYLLWIGVKMWRQPPVELSLDADARAALSMDAWRVFWHTYAVTSLNPKGIVFFMAFLPHFIAPQAPVAPQLVLLGVTFVAMGAINALVYALSASAIRERIRKPGTLRLFNRIGGSLLIGAAAMTAALRRAATS
ncbi:LysE family transporter [Microvirga tunisiensis]|uniref:LysE family transporter n=2 Tax=Pannonibacter tanglangensis TaxID=2750084 RepID=A0A7X5J810_9HYPH|nr:MULTISPECIES: LysE family translocator [unclassified Pannonibacter]NBN63346.1 LysE family transporter [Pannonibacter sp. XCT-34]NBN76981.1 LysE family transporter [Pannonibacter sp. XCT-53]